MSLPAYLQPLKQQFELLADAENAAAMKAYLRDKFEFYGIKKPELRPLFREHWKAYPPPDYSELPAIIEACWKQPQREWHYFGQELPEKYVKRKADVALLDVCEWMITHQTWWDTVDHIATKLVSVLVKRFPEAKQSHIETWSNSPNFWLQRTAILYQRDYKQNTDLDELYANILKVIDSNEFFLQKVIGWMLREYSKTDPQEVLRFVAKHEDRLAPLSKKEALRRIQR